MRSGFGREGYEHYSYPLRLTPRARARCSTTEIKRSEFGHLGSLRVRVRDAPELQGANSHLDPLMTLEVIPAADHFQIDVEVIGSLPASGQWLHGCGGQ